MTMGIAQEAELMRRSEEALKRLYPPEIRAYLRQEEVLRQMGCVHGQQQFDLARESEAYKAHQAFEKIEAAVAKTAGIIPQLAPLLNPWKADYHFGGVSSARIASET